MKIAVAQLTTSTDKKANLKKAINYITQAKKESVDLVVLPEFFISLTTSESGVTPAEAAEPLDGPFVTGLTEAARENSIYVICGTYESKVNENSRAYNTTVFINRYGEIIHSYRKTHLYDAFNNKESDTIIPGDTPYQVLNTEFGNIGLMVCYELRFPEIARQFALQGADILIVPSGWFAGAMKEDHWETLLRARAIENTMFICGSNLTGDVFTGRSMVVDPMGTINASASEEEGLLVTSIDLDRVRRVRKKLPSISHRQPEFYKQN